MVFMGLFKADACVQLAAFIVEVFWISFVIRSDLFQFKVRPILLKDFIQAVKAVRSTVVEKDLESYREWDKQFGSLGRMST